MKLLSFWRLSFLLLLLIGSGSRADTLRLAYSDTPSFPYQAGQGADPANPPGIAVEMLQDYCHSLGIALTLTRMPGKRILRALDDGSVDGAFIFSYSPERATYLRYPLTEDGEPDHHRRMATLSYQFYRLKDNPVRFDGQHVTQLTTPVGVISGYSVIQDLQTMRLAQEEARSIALNILKLQRRRLDLFAGQTLITDDYLLRHAIADIVPEGPPIATKDYFLVFGQRFYRQHTPLSESLWDMIGERRDSDIATLMQRYTD